MKKQRTQQIPYLYILIVALTAIIIGIAVLVFSPANFRYEKPVTFEIPKGQSLFETAQGLKDQHLIRSSYAFVFFTIISGRLHTFKAGTYLLSPLYSIERIITIFSKGLTQNNDITVTVPEGTNVADLDRVFAQSGLTQPGDFLHRNLLSQEGHFFPDTYNLHKDSTLDEIINKMQANFESKITVIPSGKLKQTLIIASILEKEVRNQQDMRIVAGIIERRLSRGMHLQMDATVAYGTCLPLWQRGIYCNVTQVNLRDAIHKDGPYNSYTRGGLPPGPISNPGLQSIMAALNPQKTDYLYYLTTRDGRMIYSKTSTEHEAARHKYLGL